jgi:hypothetical protein
MNRTKATGALMGALIAVCALATPAAADTPTSFTACISPTKTGGVCESGDIFAAGDTLWLRGKIRPPHSGLVAKVLMRRPGDDSWDKVDTDMVSAEGRLKWAWRTSVDDASPKLYELRFKIPGHGVSEIATALIPS